MHSLSPADAFLAALGDRRAVPARLDQDRSDSRGGQCDLSLALGLRRCGLLGAWGIATFSVWVLRVGAQLLVALGVAVVAIGGDTEAVKVTGLATGGCGCATAATDALLTGLLWRPT
jgi:hypothetical protein